MSRKIHSLVFALAVLLANGSSVHADPPQDGTITWSTGTPPWSNNDAWHGSGTYSVNTGFSYSDVNMYAIKTTDTVQKWYYTVTNSGINGSWSCDGNGLPNGEYTIWVELTIVDNGTAAEQRRCANTSHKTLTITNSTVNYPFGGTTVELDWASNKPSVAGTTISGDGTYSVPALWNLSEDSIYFEALPGLGGKILKSNIANVPSNVTWNSTSAANAIAGKTYKCMVYMIVIDSNENEVDIGSDLKSILIPN